MDTLLELLRNAGVDALENEVLSKHSSFRVGGAARAVVFPKSREEMILALSEAKRRGVRTLVLGNASNVVFSDEGYDGLVVFTGRCNEALCEGREIVASCGASLARIATLAQRNGLTGAEFLHGIPGTLGGAVFMNAGAFEGSIADVLVCSEYWNAESGEVGSLLQGAHDFSHRHSIYTDHGEMICLGARLRLSEGDPLLIRERMDDLMARRKRTQPLEYPSAGSVFKRPVGHFAGKLIQDCGLKGRTVGGAQVSEKHAGFIVNVGGATARDIRTLTETVRETVWKETGVLLECEIRFIEPR